MKKNQLSYIASWFAIFIFIATCSTGAVSQSQALNGQIEGTVTDRANEILTGVLVMAVNIESGAARSAKSNEQGIFRFPLLPLGSYRVTAERDGFRKLVRDGITLATGQNVTLDLKLDPGELQASVNVSADVSIADPGKTDLSRVVNSRDIKSLPLVSANPYNFAFLQANVTGRPARGFPFTTINANGLLRRVNFLVDGNTNTQGDRGTLRFMLLSDTFVSEVQLLTNGFAAEFGNTPGMIMNVVTPAGTNDFHGDARYRFRRPSFYSRPFFFPAADLPDNKADNFSASVGGPFIRNRWQFYFGFERGSRDDKAAAMRLLTIKETDKAQLIAAGLSPAIFPPAIPSVENGTFYIFRTDVQLNDANRLALRLNYSDVLSKNQIQGMLNTLERGTDAIVINHGIAAQLVSYTSGLLNEFRFQYSQRQGTSNNGVKNEFSGPGPAVSITGVANFGSVANIRTRLPVYRIIQIQDNLTRTSGAHSVKLGGGFNFYDQTILSDLFASYTFPSVAAYLAAKNGSNPRSYSNYVETFGEPAFRYTSNFWNLFIQDDWRVSRRLKINFGLRYDLYQIPEADKASLFSASQKFRVAKTNFAPRFGFVYALGDGERPAVLRAGAGVYFDQPLLAPYQRALQNNGNPRFFTFSFTPQSANAPLFPNTFSGSLPPGSALNLQGQNIDTISPDFENMYAAHSNIQFEKALAENLALSIGYVHSEGRHLPVYRNINVINPISVLADGRGVFSPVINSSTRRDARFNIIQMAESVGNSNYDAFNIQLTKRFSAGFQLNANYTLSKATDDAPEQNMTTGAVQGLVLSDPYNRALDKGLSFADQRHTFVMSAVIAPAFKVVNSTIRRALNNNQLAIIATANSGERFNIVSTSDINRDGVFGAGITNADRPVGIKRNSGQTPPQHNVDIKFSRFVGFSDRFKLEVIAEFQNFFNINSIVQFNNVTVATNPATGELTGPLPDFKARNQSTSQDSRQFQLGFRFIF